jgi:hypothetical protein
MKLDTSVSLDPETFAQLRHEKIYAQCTAFSNERCRDIARNIMNFRMFGVLEDGFTSRSFFDCDGNYDISDLSISWGTYWVIDEETGECTFNEDHRGARMYLGEIEMYDLSGMSYDREIAVQVMIPAEWADPALSVYELNRLMRDAADAHFPKILATLVKIEEHRLNDALAAQEELQRRLANKAAEAAALRVSLCRLQTDFTLDNFLELQPQHSI